MEHIADPVVFFESLGGLHDAGVDWMAWDGEAAEFHLLVDNLHAAFMDGDTPSSQFPGYEKRSASLVFTGARNVSGHLNPDHGGGAVISELCVERLPSHYTVRFCGIDNWYWKFDFSGVTVGNATEPPVVARHHQDYQGFLTRTR